MRMLMYADECFECRGARVDACAQGVQAHLVYLLYWYKSKYSDALGASAGVVAWMHARKEGKRNEMVALSGFVSD